MIIKIDPNIIPFTKHMKHLCHQPYPGHPIGCPNYRYKPGCPPHRYLIDDMLDFSKDAYLIYTEFEIGKHAERMKEKHPDWTERQCYCCLYWQAGARKIQKAEIARAMCYIYNLERIIFSPEAYGVNVTKLMQKHGVELEWPPRKIAGLVSLVGGRK